VPTGAGGGVEAGGCDGGAGFGGREGWAAGVGVATCCAGAEGGVAVAVVATETDGATRGDRDVGRGAAWRRAPVIAGA
jgi:hypothetical protein